MMMPSSKCVLILSLWIAWFGLLPCLFVAAAVTGDHSWFRSFGWTSSVVLAVAAWSNWRFHCRDHLNRFSALIALGMTLGMLADCYGSCLVGYFEFHSLNVAVPLFALGHVGYIWGTLDAAGKLQLTRRPKWNRTLFVTSVVYCVIGSGLWSVVVYPSNDLPSMQVPTFAYSIFLSLAAAVMATAAIFDRRFFVMAIGGFLFLASDAFLAVGLFQDNWHRLGDLCWITYGIGQMLIVYGAITGFWERTEFRSVGG